MCFWLPPSSSTSQSPTASLSATASGICSPRDGPWRWELACFLGGTGETSSSGRVRTGDTMILPNCCGNSRRWACGENRRHKCTRLVDVEGSHCDHIQIVVYCVSEDIPSRYNG